MTASFLLDASARDGLQAMDFSRHLSGLADLMEVCFAHEMDHGGRSTVREMRWLAHFGPALRLLALLGLETRPWDLGFVWAERGRVLGSVSTHRAAQPATWLIANVAVLPDHRRRGLALALMRATLDLIADRGGTNAILQVDDDNPGAIELYRRMGFTHETTRTLWACPARAVAPPLAASPFTYRLRARGEWADQFALAQQVRPHGLAWNHTLRAADFAPGLWARLDGFLAAQTEEHWVAVEDKKIIGSLTLRGRAGESQPMVLLTHPDYRGQVERPLLTRGLRRLGSGPVRIEHPTADEPANAILRDLGFQPHRILRWLRLTVK